MPSVTFLRLSDVIAERVNAVFCPVEYFHDSTEAMPRFGQIIIKYKCMVIQVMLNGMADRRKRTLC